MPGRSGIELADAAELKDAAVVVFVTAFAEFAADAYNPRCGRLYRRRSRTHACQNGTHIEAAFGCLSCVHAPRQPLRLTASRGKGVHSRRRRPLLEARADFCNAICAEGTHRSPSRSLRSSVAWAPRLYSRSSSHSVNLEDVHNVEIGSTGLMELRARPRELDGAGVPSSCRRGQVAPGGLRKRLAVVVYHRRFGGRAVGIMGGIE